MLARLAVSHSEFKTFNQHVSIILSHEKSKNFMIGDFLILKIYSFRLYRADSAIGKYSYTNYNSYLYLIN